MADLPAWLQPGAPQGRRQNRRSRAQERRVAREVGGRVTAGSGSSWRSGGGDVRAPEDLIECKYTDARSFALSEAAWHKLERQAARLGREPVMVIKFDQYDLELEVRRRG